MKRSHAIWVFAAAVLVILPSAWAISAKKLYKQGQLAEARGDTIAAYQDYYQAFQKKPTDERYKVAWERTRFTAADLWIRRGERLREQGNDTGALTDFLRALEIDPSNELASQDIQATRAQLNAQSPSAPQAASAAAETAEELAPPPELKPLSSEPITLHMVEDSRIVYQAIGKAAGINVLFDPSYASKRIQVDLNNVTLANALRIVAVVSGTFWRPITNNTIFVAEDTRAKHTELDEQAVETFYLHNVAQQNDFTEIQTVLRNLFQNARINGVSSENAIVMRGTPDELLLAHRLISDLDKPRPEVVIDVAVLEVSRDLIRNIGIQLPQTASINFQASNANLSSTSTSGTSTTDTSTSTGSTASGITLNTLAHLNSSNFAVSIGQAAVNLLLTDSRSHIIQNPEIRCSDGQEASLKIGERIPVATGSYQTGAATAIVSSLVNTQFQYIDVGVDMDIKPIVHYDGDVTLKSKITVSATNGNETIGGITEPVITQRVVDHTVRLKDGEANLLGGILQRQETLAISGTPGLAQLPLLKYIFGTRDKEISTDEIVFLMIPHVIRREDITPGDVQEIDTGTGMNVAVRQIRDKAQLAAELNGQYESGPAPAEAAAPAASPASQTNPVEAARQSLNKLRQQADAGPPADFTLTPAQTTVKPGATFKMAVDLSGGNDIFSVPLRVHYDSSKLSLVNVDLPDPSKPGFLGKDGQAITLVHRDEGNGDVDIAASRPPGVKGVSGSGTLCVLTFEAKAAGSASVAIIRPVVRNSQQQVLPATGSQAIVNVQ